MAETQWLTNKIDEIASNIAPLISVKFLNETDTYPYDISTDEATAISAINTSATNSLTVTITLLDASTLAIPIPADKIYNGEFGQIITSVNVAGTTPSFTIELAKRSV